MPPTGRRADQGCLNPWIRNLTLLCGYHHHNFNQRGWTRRLNHDRHPTWIPPRWFDPDQKPLMNTRITTRLITHRPTHRRRQHTSLLERLWKLASPPGHTYDPPLRIDAPPHLELELALAR